MNTSSQALISAKPLGVVGGSLIISGTCIGAGMLAIPVVTAQSGFLPSLVVLISCWLVMTITGIFFAELCIWQKQEANLLSMAGKTLGKVGQMVTWGLYLFLFYCLLCAYLIGGANFFADFTHKGTSGSLDILAVALLFILLVSCGKRVVDPLNRLLMVGLFLAYAGFVWIGSSAVSFSLLERVEWSSSLSALPVAFTAFGFQGTVPTLSSWMGYDRKRLSLAIVLGTSITLGIYILWQVLVLGIVPADGEYGFVATQKLGLDAVHPLQYFTNTPAVWVLGRCFAFFALSTSFLGVSLGMMDFLADGLKLKKGMKLNLASFGIPVLFAVCYPHIFLKALGLAGGIGCALLLGVLPILMIWRAEHVAGFTPPKSILIGKKPIYVAILAFVIFEIMVELCI